MKKNKIIIRLLLSICGSGLKAAEANPKCAPLREHIEILFKVKRKDIFNAMKESIYDIDFGSEQSFLLTNYLEEEKEGLKNTKMFTALVVKLMSSHIYFNLVKARALQKLPLTEEYKATVNEYCNKVKAQQVAFRNLVEDIDPALFEYHNDPRDTCNFINLCKLEEKYPLGMNDIQALQKFFYKQSVFKAKAKADMVARYADGK